MSNATTPCKQTTSAASIDAATDALLRIIVTGERERSAAANPEWRSGQSWIDTLALPATDDLDVPGLAADPIGTACRAELRRISHALYAANPGEDFTALEVEIAEMDLTHAGWRAIVLEMAWHGIGRAAPTPCIPPEFAGGNAEPGPIGIIHDQRVLG